jgi:hypothetical protein
LGDPTSSVWFHHLSVRLFISLSSKIETFFVAQAMLEGSGQSSPD